MLRTSHALALLVPSLLCGCGVFFGDQTGAGGGGGDETSASSTTTTTSTGGSGGGGGAIELVGKYRMIEVGGSVEIPAEEPLLGVPVLVTLDADVIDYAAMAPGGRDLVFADAAGSTPLPHEVERWNPNGESSVWVRVPSIGGFEVTRFRMYYGDPERSVPERPEEVWAGHYELVYHFGEAQTETRVRNSAGDDLRGLLQGGGSFDDGQIGRGRRFSQYPSEIEIENSGWLFDGWEAFSLELWILPDYGQGVAINEPRFIDKGGPMTLGRVHTDNIPEPGTTTFVNAQIDIHPIDEGCFMTTYEVPRGKLTHLAWSYEAGVDDLRAYKNGEEEGVCAASGPLGSGSNPVRLGGSTDPLHGVIDEVRIASRRHSPAWYAVQYLSMTDTLLTIGPEQTAP